MKNLIVTPAVREKLAEKHGVTVREVEQCFENKCGTYLMDDREDNRTDPPTLWFISETNKGRFLKVAFVYDNGNVHVKSAYEPEPKAVEIYDSLGK